MRSLMSLCVVICFVCAVPGDAGASVPAHLWSYGFGDGNTQIAYCTATDPSDNIIVVGTFAGTVNFGGSDLTSSGGTDIFIAKFDASGVHQWSMRFGDVTNQSAVAVALDALGNVLVVGEFTGTVNFGGGSLVSAGNEDIFLVKFSATGAHQWSKRFGDASIQRPASIALDASNNVIITGYFLGNVNFGGANLAGSGGYDVFLAKFNSGGTHQWSQRYGDTNIQHGISVAADAAGNVILTGDHIGAINFGGGNLTSAGAYDMFLAKFDSGGTHQWSQSFGDSLYQQGNAVAVDASGNVILGGHAQGTVDFGGGVLDGGPYNEDVVVAKFDPNGTHQWSDIYGDSLAGQLSSAVAVDASGNIAITGQYSGTINFGGGDLTSVGTGNMYLASLDPSGTHRWSQRYGSSFMNPHSLAFNTSGNLTVAGHFSGSANFGGSTLTPSGTDVFLAYFGGEPAQPEILDIIDVGNDQGRKVRIRFAASGVDDAVAATPIEQYEAYLRSDAPPSSTAPASSSLPAGWQRIPGWGFVASVPAHAESEYELYAPTLGDSTVALGQYYSVFFVRAATGTPSLFYDSPPDSGYSLDNLAPGVPTSFAYSAGMLTWDESTAPDFDYFSVYGANSNSFGAATLIDFTVAPTMDVTSSSYAFYFVTATDFSGNEGAPATIDLATGVSETPQQYVLSISAYPNPFNPSTMIRYTVPSRGRVEMALYDVRGARVATLVNDFREAGAYTEQWDGVDAGGRPVSSGVYFARVSHPSGNRTYKLMLLK